MLKGKSKSKVKEGWWAGLMDGQAAGQSALIKRYEGDDKRAAFQVCVYQVGTVVLYLIQASAELVARREKASNSLVSVSTTPVVPLEYNCPSHPNLPQLVGFSQGDAPTPFIVLKNGRCLTS